MPGLPHPHDPAAREEHEQHGAHQDTAAPTVNWAQWDEARRIAYGLPQTLPEILLPLAQCQDEILAESVTAEMPVPHYASAAADGWAVAGDGPWRIRTPQPAETDERLLLTLPPETTVLTGHGDATSIGAEAGHLEEWIARGH